MLQQLPPLPPIPSAREPAPQEIGEMPPWEGKHRCKHCKKTFPSYYALGGHMNLHRDRGRRAMQPKSTPRLQVEGNGAGGGGSRYGLRGRGQRAWCLSDYSSRDDEPWALVSKTECQLCFKVFASCDVLSMHMKVHTHQEKKMATVHNKPSRKVAALMSAGDVGHSVAVSAAACKKRSRRRRILDTAPPSVITRNGTEEVDAACILLMLSGDPDKHSTPVGCHEDCKMLDHKDCEIDSYLADHMQMTEMDLKEVDWQNELMKPESSSSNEEMKFSSLSQVLKATAIYECNLCGMVFSSGQALGGHKKGHKNADHESVATFPKSAVAQPRKQLLDVDHESLVLGLPDLRNQDYSSGKEEPEMHPWWVGSGHQTERMPGVL